MRSTLTLALVCLDDDVNGRQLDVVGSRPDVVVLLVFEALDSLFGLGAAAATVGFGVALVVRRLLLQDFLQPLPGTQRLLVDPLGVGNFRSRILKRDEKEIHETRENLELHHRGILAPRKRPNEKVLRLKLGLGVVLAATSSALRI